jgi:hypothetical protein
MSDAQNQEFAYYMTEHINGKLDIHSTMVSPENYYTVSKTLKQANWTEI